MLARKPTPERKSRSGSYVPNDLRGTVRVEVRCSSELAERVRAVAQRKGVTLAKVLEIGADELEARPRELTPAEDEAACRADAEYERMREDD